ncbi:hypothetical protein ACFW04_011998 [Cataglyphis niger]
MGNKVDNFGNMKLSVIQESDRNGTRKLPQNQISNNETRMNDTTNDKYFEDNGTLAKEEGSMVSNLPLLFANGYPTSLEKITMVQLERFILFMVHCSLGHDTTKLINRPKWWPQDIKFSNPLTRPKKINDNWMANLKKLVFRCYTYHRSEYLLRFCSYLAQYPHEELEYVNNWDSTTSLYHKSTGKLLVTFRNENMYYDKKNDSPRRTLLSHNASSSGYGNKTKQQQTPMMVQPPCDDIYLCDNCDAEFIGLAKMKEHEKMCCEQDHDGNGSRSSSPNLSAAEPEVQQDQFLEYFQLFSNKTEAKSICANNASVPDNSIRRTSRRVRSSFSFARYATIPFSSPAGIMLAKKSKAMTEDTQQERLDRIERHVIAPVLNDSCRPKWLDTEVDCDKWIVTHKQNRDKLTNDYVHQYKFMNSFKSKPMLSIRSQLLYVTCRPIYVVLTRLSEKQIDELKKDSSKYQCPQKSINVRKVLLMRRVGPACKTKSKKATCEQNVVVSSKRKAPLGNELDPIIVEDEDADINATAKETLIAFTAVKSPLDDVEIIKPIKERKCPSNTIMLIDLCSSDEEENDQSSRTPCDENRDPMTTTDSPIAKTFLRKLTPKQTLREALHLPRTLIDRLVIEQRMERS